MLKAFGYVWNWKCQLKKNLETSTFLAVAYIIYDSYKHGTFAFERGLNIGITWFIFFFVFSLYYHVEKEITGV